MRLLFLFIEFDGNNEGNSSTNGLKWLFFFRVFFRGSGASSDFSVRFSPWSCSSKNVECTEVGGDHRVGGDSRSIVRSARSGGCNI